MTLICLLKNSMRVSNDHTKATALINALDLVSIDVIIPQLPEGDWSYKAARHAVIKEFGSEKIIQACN